MHGCRRSLRGFETGKIVSVNDQELLRRNIGKYLKRYSDAILFFPIARELKNEECPLAQRPLKLYKKRVIINCIV